MNLLFLHHPPFSTTLYPPLREANVRDQSLYLLLDQFKKTHRHQKGCDISDSSTTYTIDTFVAKSIQKPCPKKCGAPLPNVRFYRSNS